MKHENNGHCVKCAEIFDHYRGFNETLRHWFESFQLMHPEAHISCAGRGHIDQEVQFQKGASRAHWGQSAHNWNAAIDVFAMIQGAGTIYPLAWFHTVLGPMIPDFLEWYGKPGAKFPELPHIEIKGWRAEAQAGRLFLVD